MYHKFASFCMIFFYFLLLPMQFFLSNAIYACCVSLLVFFFKDPTWKGSIQRDFYLFIISFAFLNLWGTIWPKILLPKFHIIILQKVVAFFNFLHDTYLFASKRNNLFLLQAKELLCLSLVFSSPKLVYKLITPKLVYKLITPKLVYNSYHPSWCITQNTQVVLAKVVAIINKMEQRNENLGVVASWTELRIGLCVRWWYQQSKHHPLSLSGNAMST
jgi:hypothetical protein